LSSLVAEFGPAINQSLSLALQFTVWLIVGHSYDYWYFYTGRASYIRKSL